MFAINLDSSDQVFKVARLLKKQKNKMKGLARIPRSISSLYHSVTDGSDTEIDKPQKRKGEKKQHWDESEPEVLLTGNDDWGEPDSFDDITTFAGRWRAVKPIQQSNDSPLRGNSIISLKREVSFQVQQTQVSESPTPTRATTMPKGKFFTSRDSGHRKPLPRVPNANSVVDEEQT